MFAKNERGYRLNAVKKRLWSLLILLLAVASISRKLLKTIITIKTNYEKSTDRSKISSDQKRFFIALSLYPLSFLANTPFKTMFLILSKQVVAKKSMFFIKLVCVHCTIDAFHVHWTICIYNFSSTITLLFHCFKYFTV